MKFKSLVLQGVQELSYTGFPQSHAGSSDCTHLFHHSRKYALVYSPLNTKMIMKVMMTMMEMMTLTTTS